MAWNAKYWDILNNLYWTPKYLGLESIPRKKWHVDGDRISIPRDLVKTADGPLYFRARKVGDLMSYLEGQEEILNHLFDLTFSIAGDDVINHALCRPLGIDDQGPFTSIGRDIGQRYGWSPLENVTQQDGFFVSPRSVIGVELKLGSKSSPEQIAKYLALMMWEERKTEQRRDLGLLFVVAADAVSSLWQDLGLKCGSIDDEFVDRTRTMKLPLRIRQLFDASPDGLKAAANRLKLSVVSWKRFRDDLTNYRSRLDLSRPGDQTLDNLLRGFCDQIDRHGKTGIRGRGELVSLETAASDRELHEGILGDGDGAEVTAVGRNQAKQAGHSGRELGQLYDD